MPLVFCMQEVLIMEMPHNMRTKKLSLRVIHEIQSTQKASLNPIDLISGIVMITCTILTILQNARYVHCHTFPIEALRDGNI